MEQSTTAEILRQTPFVCQAALIRVAGIPSVAT